MSAEEYIPRCELDGSYSPTQCWGSVVECWCVHKDGSAVENSRTQGKPACDRRKSLLMFFSSRLAIVFFSLT